MDKTKIAAELLCIAKELVGGSKKAIGNYQVRIFVGNSLSSGSTKTDLDMIENSLKRYHLETVGRGRDYIDVEGSDRDITRLLQSVSKLSVVKKTKRLYV